MKKPINAAVSDGMGLAADILDRAGYVLNSGLLREVALGLHVTFGREDGAVPHTFPMYTGRAA